MEDTTYTRAQVTTALGTAHGMIEAVTSAGPVNALTVCTWAQLTGLGSGPYTREQVAHALNEAANALDEDIEYEDSDTIWAQDVRNLAVSTALYLLEHPAATLGGAITAQYADIELSFSVLDALPGSPAVPAAGTPERDAAIVATVLGRVS